MTLVGKYWGEERTYHHTAPVSMNYALREALRLVAEEGLDDRWDRHLSTAEMLWDGLADLGIECQVAKEYRLPSLTTAVIPDNVDGKAVAAYLLQHFNIEIAAGLGQLAGKVWRIGLMGFNSRQENVLLLVSAMEKAIEAVG
jgi:alanine-glyoxylate transaminase/serine-glyoxylate transaminase/serine-pyruvate transaminase